MIPAHAIPPAGSDDTVTGIVCFAFGLAIGILGTLIHAARRQEQRRRHHAKLRAERWQWQ